jgi:hypothetical protein
MKGQRAVNTEPLETGLYLQLMRQHEGQHARRVCLAPHLKVLASWQLGWPIPP